MYSVYIHAHVYAPHEPLFCGHTIMPPVLCPMWPWLTHCSVQAGGGGGAGRGGGAVKDIHAVRVLLPAQPALQHAGGARRVGRPCRRRAAARAAILPAVARGAAGARPCPLPLPWSCFLLRFPLPTPVRLCKPQLAYTDMLLDWFLGRLPKRLICRGMSTPRKHIQRQRHSRSRRRGACV